MTTADEILDWAWRKPDRATAERMAKRERCLCGIRHVVDKWLADDQEDASCTAALAICALLGEAGQ
jgi:hypothetical protein